jgi:hypothetical protein
MNEQFRPSTPKEKQPIKEANFPEQVDTHLDALDRFAADYFNNEPAALNEVRSIEVRVDMQGFDIGCVLLQHTKEDGADYILAMRDAVEGEVIFDTAAMRNLQDSYDATPRHERAARDATAQALRSQYSYVEHFVPNINELAGYLPETD